MSTCLSWVGVCIEHAFQTQCVHASSVILVRFHKSVPVYVHVPPLVPLMCCVYGPFPLRSLGPHPEPISVCVCEPAAAASSRTSATSEEPPSLSLSSRVKSNSIVSQHCAIGYLRSPAISSLCSDVLSACAHTRSDFNNWGISVLPSLSY